MVSRSRRSAAVGITALALAAAVLVAPWVGILIGALAYWSTRDRRVRLLIRYAPAVIIAGIALHMALAQAVDGYPTGTHWPAKFAFARIPTWIALFPLLVDAVVEWVWRSS